LNSDISDNPNEIIKVADAFTDHGDDVLESIEKNLQSKTDRNIDDTSTYEKANQAFEKDIKNTQEKLIEQKDSRSSNDDIYNNIAKYNRKEQQLGGLLSIVDRIKILIEHRRTPQVTANSSSQTPTINNEAQVPTTTNEIQNPININPTIENAITTFETIEKYNAMFDLLMNNNNSIVAINYQATNTNTNEYKFVQLLKKYNNINNDNEISNIKI
jgi:hypothetical protein